MEGEPAHARRFMTGGAPSAGASSFALSSRSFSAASGLIVLENVLRSPRYPGTIRSNMHQRSSILFSIGVPVRPSTKSAFNAFASLRVQRVRRLHFLHFVENHYGVVDASKRALMIRQRFVGCQNPIRFAQPGHVKGFTRVGSAGGIEFQPAKLSAP
jgi:hypothetical protein